MPESVLCCEADKAAIVETIKTVLAEDFHYKVCGMSNPFGDGNTSLKITQIIRNTFETGDRIDVSKHFYDIV